MCIPRLRDRWSSAPSPWSDIALKYLAGGEPVLDNPGLLQRMDTWFAAPHEQQCAHECLTHVLDDTVGITGEFIAQSVMNYIKHMQLQRSLVDARLTGALPCRSLPSPSLRVLLYSPGSLTPIPISPMLDILRRFIVGLHAFSFQYNGARGLV